jgi:hypothetical protein
LGPPAGEQRLAGAAGARLVAPLLAQVCGSGTNLRVGAARFPKEKRVPWAALRAYRASAPRTRVDAWGLCLHASLVQQAQLEGSHVGRIHLVDSHVMAEQ